MKNKKTVLVTGGSVRLGKKICIDLSLDGYNIIVHYNKSKKNALKLKKEILVNGGNCEIIKCDFSKKKEVGTLIKKSSKIFGPLYALINNASIFENDRIINFNEKQWEKHLTINLYSPLKLSQDLHQCLPKKKQSPYNQYS